jgi:signal transduction histidine kinase
VLGSAGAAAGRALVATPYDPAELAAAAAAAAREVTGAPYAVVTLDGFDPVGDPPGAAPGEVSTVWFEGGSLGVAGGDVGALRELAPYVEIAALRACELARRRDVNDVMRHDLRTRLGIGKGYVSMLLRHHDALTPEQRQAAVAGLAAAFDQLEEFSRGVLLDDQLEVFGVHPHRGDLPVRPLVEAVRSTRPEVEVDVAAAPETVRADALLAKAVLTELVSNAVAAAPGGRVVLAALPDGDGVRFEVCDDGPGVPEDERALIWERFARTARSRAARAPGMGLGLANVRRIMDAHGGAYGLRAVPGETTFWVTFPDGDVRG